MYQGPSEFRAALAAHNQLFIDWQYTDIRNEIPMPLMPEYRSDGWQNLGLPCAHLWEQTERIRRAAEWANRLKKLRAEAKRRLAAKINDWTINQNASNGTKRGLNWGRADWTFVTKNYTEFGKIIGAEFGPSERTIFDLLRAHARAVEKTNCAPISACELLNGGSFSHAEREKLADQFTRFNELRARFERREDRWERPVWAYEPWYVGSEYAERHMLHVSLTQKGLLAYTQNLTKMVADVQTPIKPGRYLTKYFSDVLSEVEIRHWAQKQQMALDSSTTIYFVENDDPDGWVQVYENGSGYSSCMVMERGDRYIHGGLTQEHHPVRAYARPGNGLRLAFMRSPSNPEQNVARAIVREFADGNKQYVRVYGDDRLRILLEKEGYVRNSQALQDVLLNYIQHPHKDYSYYCVLPYLDGDQEFHLVLDENDNPVAIVPHCDGTFSSGSGGISDLCRYWERNPNYNMLRIAEDGSFLWMRYSQNEKRYLSKGELAVRKRHVCAHCRNEIDEGDDTTEVFIDGVDGHEVCSDCLEDHYQYVRHRTIHGDDIYAYIDSDDIVSSPSGRVSAAYAEYYYTQCSHCCRYRNYEEIEVDEDDNTICVHCGYTLDPQHYDGVRGSCSSEVSCAYNGEFILECDEYILGHNARGEQIVCHDSEPIDDVLPQLQMLDGNICNAPAGDCTLLEYITNQLSEDPPQDNPVVIEDWAKRFIAAVGLDENDDDIFDSVVDLINEIGTFAEVTEGENNGLAATTGTGEASTDDAAVQAPA